MANDHKLILASRVEHTPVFNEDDWLIGHIKDLSIDRETGQVVWAIMSFGGFLGIGSRLHPLPWSMLEYDTRHHGFIVPMSREALNDAPHYDAAELEDFGGPSQERKRQDVLEYYGPFAPPPL